MYDGSWRCVTRFSADGHPKLREAVLDTTRDRHEEMVVLGYLRVLGLHGGRQSEAGKALPPHAKRSLQLVELPRMLVSAGWSPYRGDMIK